MSEASGRYRWVFIAAAAAGLLAAAAGAATWILWFQPETRPAFTMTDLEGDERAISEWDGDLVVLNFWASWCRPCVEEIPVFTELQADYGDQGLQMLGVAVDNRDAARDFSERLEMNYPSFQGTTSGMELVEAYGNQRGTLPYTVVIDRDGTIVHRFDREIERDDIEPVIRKHL
ncbi:MAG: TlpA disulfide reductase family protein [Ectothiorhodospiraceae bacterium]